MDLIFKVDYERWVLLSNLNLNMLKVICILDYLLYMCVNSAVVFKQS